MNEEGTITAQRKCNFHIHGKHLEKTDVQFSAAIVPQHQNPSLSETKMNLLTKFQITTKEHRHVFKHVCRNDKITEKIFIFVYSV